VCEKEMTNIVKQIAILGHVFNTSDTIKRVDKRDGEALLGIPPVGQPDPDHLLYIPSHTNF